jgi:hypothetical protein
MIKKWREFIKEFFKDSMHDIIDAKMNELKDLVDGVSDGQNILYEWENKNDHQLIINFTIDENSVRYEFDIDNMSLVKIVNSDIKFQIHIKTIDEGFDFIEKDINSIIGINEKFYKNQYKYFINEKKFKK